MVTGKEYRWAGSGIERPGARLALRGNRAGYFAEHRTMYVNESTPDAGRDGASLTSSGYRISVDEGRDSFYALCIEDPDEEGRWLMSDTVRSLQDAR